MNTAVTELLTFIENEPLISATCKTIVKKKAKELLDLEREQLTDAWAAGHRVAIRDPKHDTNAYEYYEEQFS